MHVVAVRALLSLEDRQKQASRRHRGCSRTVLDCVRVAGQSHSARIAFVASSCAAYSLTLLAARPMPNARFGPQQRPRSPVRS